MPSRRFCHAPRLSLGDIIVNDEVCLVKRTGDQFDELSAGRSRRLVHAFTEPAGMR